MRAHVATTVLLVGFVHLQGCRVGYLAEAGWYQAEMLVARQPIDDILDEGRLSTGQEQRLRRVPEIKAFGRTLGLAATENYDALAVGWDRTIWNVSACDPLSFTPVTWWFPIVGRVPYLGFFVESDAREQARRLAEGGSDVHVRTAGAYSTLGWFRDPVLPGMLRWTETQLAETVFHELTHATLWVPGSVAFNESFASFVGEASTVAWLDATYGAGSAERAAWDRERRDEARFDAILQGLYKDLDTLYSSPVPDEEKRVEKASLLGSLPSRIEQSTIEDRARWIAWAERGSWNNARLAQFKTYNQDRAVFEVVWERSGGTVSGFVAEVRTRALGADDPWEAMRAVP